MRPVHFAIILSVFTVPLPVAAQSEPAAPSRADAENTGQLGAQDVSAAPDDQPAPEKKKGGLFGKVKGIAKNKVVRQVAKTAACTMVPGGQVIAGAIDAASTKSAGEAAAGAARAATGSNCIPGMGAPALGGGVAGAAAQAVAGQAGAGASLGGLTPGMPLGGAGHGSVSGMPSPEKFAACLGLTPKEFQELSDPTHGQPRAMTKDEMKRQAELAQKLDMQRYQACIMQH